MKWIRFKDKWPEDGQLVLIYRKIKEEEDFSELLDHPLSMPCVRVTFTSMYMDEDYLLETLKDAYWIPSPKMPNGINNE